LGQGDCVCLSALEPEEKIDLFSRCLETTSFPSATFAEFYRFALLLTGNVKVAEHVMADTLAEVESQLAQFRNEASRRAWLATRIRERCLKNNASAPPSAPRLLRNEPETEGNPEILEIEAFLLAQRFHTLPEPERSALALFYLELFDIAELAQVLKMSEDTLSETLGSARGLLKQSLSAGVASPPAV
jgi:RNA polymerase sigma factor (sigma-70 family)